MILQAGHHARQKTNSPIFGILMQPMPSAWLHHPQLKKRDGSNQFYTRYFESSHAEFLMAGGARVVPVDYRLEEKELVNLLEQINGLYIPGDTKQTYLDPEVQIQVSKILRWAQEHNTDHAQHFPVVAMGYGMPTMLQSQFQFISKIEEMPKDIVGAALE